MKKALTPLLIALFLLVLTACNSYTTPNGAGETADPLSIPDEPLPLTSQIPHSIGQASFFTQQGTSDAGLIYCIASVENTGEENGYMGGCSFDLLDTSGEIIGNLDITNASAQILEPGETAYIWSWMALDDLQADVAGIEPRVSLRPTSYEKDAIVVSGIKLTEDKFYGIIATGSVKNNEVEEIGTLTNVGCVLLDGEGKPLTALSINLEEPLAPGAEAAFQISDMYYPKDVTLERIESFIPFGYQFRIVLN